VAYLQLVIGPPLAAMAPDPVLVWDAVFLDEGPINMRPDDLAGGDGHSVGLVETRDQSGKRHPYMCKGGHAGAHDSHPSPCGGPGEVLPRYA